MKITYKGVHIDVSILEVAAGVALLWTPSPAQFLKRKGSEMTQEIKPEIKESQELVRGVVAVAKALEEAKASNGGIGFDDMALLFKISPELNAAIDHAWGIKDEFKNYNRDNIATLAGEALGGFQAGSHSAVFIVAAFDLVDAGVKAFEAVNRVIDTVKGNTPAQPQVQ